MCAVLGVDPLSGPTGGSGAGSSKSISGSGFWGGLGLGEWSYELCVQVVDVCVSTRGGNGGMIEMNELIRRVSKMRGVDASNEGGGEITSEDIKRAIGLLKPLAGYSVIPIAGMEFVRSVPRELDTDQSTLLVVAADDGGRLTEAGLRRKTGWSDVRARQALEDAVMREGLGWVDEQGSERSVWLIAAVDFVDRGG